MRCIYNRRLICDHFNHFYIIKQHKCNMSGIDPIYIAVFRINIDKFVRSCIDNKMTAVFSYTADELWESFVVNYSSWNADQNMHINPSFSENKWYRSQFDSYIGTAIKLIGIQSKKYHR